MTSGAELDARWQAWRGRRPAAELIYLDNASAGRSSAGTMAAMAGHLEREAARGPYIAEGEAADALAKGTEALAGLLGVPAAGLAYVESASAALHALLSAWPLSFGDRVAVLPCEWGPNLYAFEHAGLEVTELGALPDGSVDLPALQRQLAARPPAVVHLTQVTSHRALVQPAAEAAALCRAAGVPLWVDAAQAIGHVDTASGADAVYATGRKWLTGPRGVGMLAIAPHWWDRLQIRVPGLERGALPAGAGPVWFLQSHEANVAGRIGLCQAVREFCDEGPAAVWARLAAVGQMTREALAGVPGWQVAGSADAGSAITALRPVNGQDVATTKARLLAEHGIDTTAGATGRAPREMTEPLLRISPHVDCVPEHLAALRRALIALGLAVGDDDIPRVGGRGEYAGGVRVLRDADHRVAATRVGLDGVGVAVGDGDGDVAGRGGGANHGRGGRETQVNVSRVGVHQDLSGPRAQHGDVPGRRVQVQRHPRGHRDPVVGAAVVAEECLRAALADDELAPLPVLVSPGLAGRPAEVPGDLDAPRRAADHRDVAGVELHDQAVRCPGVGDGPGPGVQARLMGVEPDAGGGDRDPGDCRQHPGQQPGQAAAATHGAVPR
jgi:hercynylcysteine S-oxide lyase